ncbi:chemotaxis-specific protein-glutamate methyltransferase CheB [Sphingomonas endophytica]|uniref:Protein-glutamate methylesterase/protein-glutamine glutaminase n=1 Tax=Sphingomonas endophytica TaxID=869719 RepID=A0ABR6N2T4_9SPHN|nr:chemotaxis-specific protein-glutamate methyltransferase CheB [Sphingomonas endophytica]MBB5725098.1 two-component system chemotaxis response regulator CheB [Sphingomonas endophytica]
MSAVRVLVVDDSALMRRHLVQLLENEKGLEVQSARNGEEALTLIEQFDPHVVTLDVNMPQMDGITCLARIMVGSPRPVIMVSSITESGAEATLQALSLGALDYVQKPGGTISLSLEQVADELIRKIRMAVKSGRRTARGALSSARPLAASRPTAAAASDVPTRLPRPIARAAPEDPPGLVLIGVSTGGPLSLEQILPALPAQLPWPVIVAQHMPRSFTGVFARRLDKLCPLRVSEVATQTDMLPGNIYIARGDSDVLVVRRAGRLFLTAVPASETHAWHPSVTRMVESAAEHVPAERLLCVQLTGMGDDGAEAMATLKRQGARTIAQDEDSCAVFGMPHELIRRGGATAVLPTHAIAGQIARWLNTASLRRAG